MLLARVDPKDGRRQPLKDHLRNVAALCQRAAAGLGLCRLACLIAVLHDVKGPCLTEYMLWCAQHPGQKAPPSIPHPAHAPVGAIYAYERWFNGGHNRKLTAQIVSLAVYSHHAELPDCLNRAGESPYLKAMRWDKDKLFYREAVDAFLQEIISAHALDELFQCACSEVEVFIERMEAKAKPYQTGLLVRLMLSLLVDMDRWDAACFQFGVNPLASRDETPNWDAMQAKLNAWMQAHFPGEGPLDALRRQLARQCQQAANWPSGVYRLTVPAGEQPLLGMHYALGHALAFGMRRICYVAPLHTALDRTASTLRGALGEGASVLVHQTDIVQESQAEATNDKQLTQRWTAPIILTDQAQFLSALYDAETQKVRRMHALAHSVLVFEEVHALPRHCRKMFEQAVRFLSRCCGCTVLLCSAIWPAAALEIKALVPQAPSMLSGLRPVRYVPHIQMPKPDQEAADILTGALAQGNCALAVADTQKAALGLYAAAKAAAASRGYVLHGCAAGHRDAHQGDAGERDILLALLNESMCPAHRQDVARRLLAWTELNRLALCLCTSSAQASIGVRFPLVMCSLTDLPAMLQAAAHCAPSGDCPSGTLLLCKLAGEDLTQLSEMEGSLRSISLEILHRYQNEPHKLTSPEALAMYFKKREAVDKKWERFPYRPWSTTLYEMLSTNGACRTAAYGLAPSPLDQLSGSLLQGFRTAGKAFSMELQTSGGVIVPYEGGKAVIEALGGQPGLRQTQALLRQAQDYTVSLPQDAWRTLASEGALMPIGRTGAVALHPAYYHPVYGVCFSKTHPDHYPQGGDTH